MKASDFIAEFEGFVERPYLCPAGKWTIGFGDTEWNGKPVTTLTKRITRTQGKDALEKRIAGFQLLLDRIVTIPTSGNQNIALISLMYNIGQGAFKRSTLLKLLNAGDPRRAADQFLLWNKARVNGVRVPMLGLTRRRKAERALFLKG